MLRALGGRVQVARVMCSVPLAEPLLVQLQHVDDVALNGRMALELPAIEPVDEDWRAWMSGWSLTMFQK